MVFLIPEDISWSGIMEENTHEERGLVEVHWLEGGVRGECSYREMTGYRRGSFSHIYLNIYVIVCNNYQGVYDGQQWQQELEYQADEELK